MNCANHPETPAATYCQQCGKPMCPECARAVGNMVHCEQCLAARLGVGLPGQAPPFFPSAHPNPALAGLLGFIPGVGAMYNNQFVKALVHVLIFALFVSLCHASGLFGLFVMAWVFYQVFDAYQTARARRDGLPLPDPFGLNDLGQHLGIATPFPPMPPPPPSAAPSATAVPGAAESVGGAGANSAAGANIPSDASRQWGGQSGAATAAGFRAAGAPSPGAPYSYYVPPIPAPPFPLPPPGPAESHAPTGAIVLIVVGLFLLLETLGLVHAFWVGRLWPLLFVALGIWLAVRSRRKPGGGVQ